LVDVPQLEQQLMGLVWRGGKIDHASGEHDDWTNATAGATVLAANVATVGPLDMAVMAMNAQAPPVGAESTAAFYGRSGGGIGDLQKAAFNSTSSVLQDMQRAFGGSSEDDDPFSRGVGTSPSPFK
jgi:hypothetical protein